MDQSHLRNVVCILDSLFRGYFDALATSHALNIPYTDAIKVFIIINYYCLSFHTYS